MNRSDKKTASPKIKKELAKRLTLMIVSGVLLVFVAVYSFGWFSINSVVTTTSLKVVVSTANYDILIDRTSVYDALDGEDNPLYDYIVGTGELKDKLGEKDYDLTETDTVDASKIAYEMINEYSYEGKKYLLPGAYGQVVFYIRPATAGADVEASLRIDLGGYVKNYDEVNDVYVMEEVTADSVLNIMKGHILFFTGRSGADFEHFVYTGLIQDGVLSIDTSEMSLCEEVGKTDCYKIVLYWDWPVTYDEITENISTVSPAATKKFPADLEEYISENVEFFFADMAHGTDISGYTDEQLSDAYNDGDQIIGVWADCLVVYIYPN